jgi:hypothetical protein
MFNAYSALILSVGWPQKTQNLTVPHVEQPAMRLSSIFLPQFTQKCPEEPQSGQKRKGPSKSSESAVRNFSCGTCVAAEDFNFVRTKPCMTFSEAVIGGKESDDSLEAVVEAEAMSS